VETLPEIDDAFENSQQLKNLQGQNIVIDFYQKDEEDKYDIYS